jgi:hypothetical protein
MLLLNTSVLANCPKFTFDQDYVLQIAFVTGYEYDRGYTLAAIAWKESMIGGHIIRVNTSDGLYGSWGVGNMQLTTAMLLTDLDNSWEARAVLAPKMMNNDVFSLDLSMQYLLRYQHLEWFQQIMKYNGAGEAAEKYAEDVIERVHLLRECNYFEE